MRSKPENNIVLYQDENGITKVSVRFSDEDIWLTQLHIAEIYDTSKQNIGQHIKNIVSEGELSEDSVVKKFFTTAADGKEYATNHYNLDMIIAIGYRVQSQGIRQKASRGDGSLGRNGQASPPPSRRDGSLGRKTMHLPLSASHRDVSHWNPVRRLSHG